jgi:hypothetical protein
MNQGRFIAAALFTLAWLPLLASADDRADGTGVSAVVAPLPARLSETGLFAPGSVTEITPRALAFAPQYPLWSDGATKRRWISLPPGTFIDAANPDAWAFPVGTKLWKEFAHGSRVETRYIERATDGAWRFGTYVWNAEGTDATLASADGIAALPLSAVQGGGTYAIPGEYDCRACHEGAPVPVLGFSALQLSPDRDPLAPHAEASSVDLAVLVANGLLRNLPREMLATPPRIAARTPTERAALGYLHGNCGHCHSAPTESGASVPVGIVLAQSVAAAARSADAVRRTLVDAASRFRPHGGPAAPSRLVVPGRSAASVLSLRMRSRDPRVQMPPLGTALADGQAVDLIDQWIDRDLNQQQAVLNQTHQEETSPWTATFAPSGSR